MDVIERVTSFDANTGRIEMFVEPDPLRYEWQERDGERVLYDRFDRTIIPHSLVMEMLKQAMTMRRPPPLAVLADIDWYVEERKPYVDSALDGHGLVAEDRDASDELLASLAGDQLGFVVMSLDVVDSSSISNTVDTATLGRVFGTLLTEVSTLVALFHGHVLRYAGDGLVAYFPEPGFITKNDLAIDCAHCARRLVYDVLNPALERRGLRPLDVRVGLDAGEAAVLVLGSPETKRHADIIGDVVSLACNIESVAGPGEVLIGDTVVRNLHVTWRQQTEPRDVPEGWSLRGPDGELYRLHRLNADVSRPIEAPPRRVAGDADGA